MKTHTSQKCDVCKGEIHYRDEMVFFLNKTVVYVDEQYPDWDEVHCLTCAEEKSLI